MLPDNREFRMICVTEKGVPVILKDFERFGFQSGEHYFCNRYLLCLCVSL